LGEAGFINNVRRGWFMNFDEICHSGMRWWKVNQVVNAHWLWRAAPSV